ncbi:MAG: hypothetical protein ABJE80_13680, partial [Reichenbachiella sp.]|uniref:beta strand repeat-containing protein n=1 Tax=Reichenbachiella sp. TaxID=2184521 RepID=UPI003262F3C2
LSNPIYDQVALTNTATSNAATAANLPAGTYTALVTDETTNCTESLEFDIVENFSTPVIDNTQPADVTITEVQRCEGNVAFPDGIIELSDVTSTGYTDPFNHYNYTWYIGTSNAGTVITNGTDIITQKGETPAATVNVSGATTNRIVGLNAGFYTVEATNKVTGCISAELTLQVTENLTVITMGETPVSNQINCTGDPNGETIITATGSGHTFAYEFFVGSNTNLVNKLGIAPLNADPTYDQVTITNATTSNAATIADLPAGTYTALATDDLTSCTESLEFTITENLTDIPVIDITNDPADVDVTEVSACLGSTAYANGAIELKNVTTGIDTDAVNDFNYVWYIGNSNTGTVIANGSDIGTQKGATATAINVSGATTNHIVGLDTGDYTVEATNIATGCLSAAVVVTVTESLEVITMGETPVSDQINCSGDPSGSSTITASDPGGHTFTYEFFVGQNTNAANKLGVAPMTANPTYDQVTLSTLTGVNAATASKLPAGTYTALVTDETTSCTQSREFTITETLTLPNVDGTLGTTIGTEVVVTENTSCSGATTYPNGAIRLGLIDGANNYTNYSYAWYFGSSVNVSNLISAGTNILAQKGGSAGTGTVAINNTVGSISNLDAGDYTVVVTNNTTGCASTELTISVSDNLPAITPTASVTQDDFACDASNPTGQVTGNILNYDGAGVAANVGFTIEWFKGSNTLATNLLPAAITGATATQDAQGNDHIISNLPDGTYTVKITNNTTNCFGTDEVIIRRATPVVTLTPSDTDQTNCTPNGQAAVALNALTYSDGGGIPIGFTPAYSYSWHEGQDNSAAALGETTGTLSNQIAGYYTVVVTETSSGCASPLTTIQIVDEVSNKQPTADIRAFGTQPISGIIGNVPGSCNANDGIIIANITTNPNGNNLALSWYAGSDDYTDGSGTELTTNAASVNGTATSAYASLGVAGSGNGYPSGLYSLLMEDLTTGCIYQQVFDLPFNGQQATTTLSIEHVEECPDNGVARVGMGDNITITYNTLTGTFDDGEIVTGAPSTATGVVGFDNGTTTMQISTATGTFAVGDVITGGSTGAFATIASITGDDTTPGSRDGLVDDIRLYDIYLFTGAGVPPGYTGATIISGTTVTNADDLVEFTGLPAGTYTAVARERAGQLGGGQCYSAASTDVIEQRAYTPIIDNFTITDNTICDFANFPIGLPSGNGSITVNGKKNADDLIQLNNFEFRWYVSGAQTFGADEIQINTNVLSSTINSLDPGDYVLDIYRLGLAGPASNGCVESVTYTVNHVPELHAITGGTITHITNCNATTAGQIVIADAEITDNVADYIFTWYQSDATTVIGGFLGASLSGRTAGTYYAKGIRQSNGCETPLFEYEILDNTSDPTITLSLNTIDTSCDATVNQGNGIINWALDANDGANYSFQWYAGTTVAGGT